MPQGVQLSTRFGSLVSTLALELLDCWDRLSTRTTPAADSGPMASKASELLRRAMPMLLSCLAADELVVSACTLSFLHSYVGRLRKLVRSPAELAEHEPHLQHLLIALARKSLYPDDFDFENGDEPEELFNAFRREGATLFKGVARVHPSLAQEFVRATLQATLAALPDVPWTHLEVALFLLFQLGEGLPEASVRDKSGVFQHMMTALLSSPASAHPHQGVQLLFFETAVRYYRFFLANPTFLPVALACFLDGRGLHNQQPRVRSRCCYLLLRFAKLTLKSTDAASLEGIIGALVDVLSQPPSEQLEQDVRLLRLGVPGVLANSEWWFWEAVAFMAGELGTASLAAHTVAYSPFFFSQNSIYFYIPDVFEEFVSMILQFWEYFYFPHFLLLFFVPLLDFLNQKFPYFVKFQRILNYKILDLLSFDSNIEYDY